MHYLELLERLHEAIQPRVYLEIGGELGSALALSRTRSILIDPELRLRPPALADKPWIKLYRLPSDEFFRGHTPEATLEGNPLDLAFIDGYHEFTQVVRDLENVERWGHARTVVVIHDVVPVNAVHASRQFHTGPWTGDVWRIVPFLREHRPDLVSRLIAVADTGALVVTGLDPGFHGMAEQAGAVNRDFPPDGPDYEAVVKAYLSSVPLVSPAEFFRDYPRLARSIPHHIESPGWSRASGTGVLSPVADQHDQPLLIALEEPVRFSYRVRMALTAHGMDAVRLAFRRDGHGKSTREQRVHVDVARPESLSHDLERVAVASTPSRPHFALEIEGALGPGEWLRDIAVQPVNAEGNAVPAAPGMAIALERIEIEQIPAVGRVVHHLPDRFADRPRPAKRRRGLRDAVLFAWYVPPRMPDLGEYYLNLLRYYHPDSKLFIGMNHGSDPGWESHLRTSGLDVEVRWARPEIGDYWDTTGSLTALESLHHSEEVFDLVWFGHTKGASGAKHTDYHRNRLDVQRNFWARRAEIDDIFGDSKIGVFARRFTPWWDGIAGEELPALQRIYRDAYAPLGLGAFDTYFVMRDDIVRRFCRTVADGFFRTPPGDYGANRWFIEMALPSVASMQGFEPYIDPDVPGADDPREDAWLRYDPKQNHRLALRELERWRCDPVAYQPVRIRQIWGPQ